VTDDQMTLITLALQISLPHGLWAPWRRIWEPAHYSSRLDILRHAIITQLRRSIANLAR